tara:strand:- start:93579 stop:93989 length:411 start_codon:yes stop_codon:yes gene_type:complete
VPKTEEVNPKNFLSIGWEEKRGTLTRVTTIESARIRSLASIVKNNIIKEEAYGDVRPWFLFDCTAPGWNGAKFWLLSDGEEWHGVDEYVAGHFRVTNNLRPKNSVNLRHLSAFDKGMLQKMIRSFIRAKSEKKSMV